MSLIILFKSCFSVAHLLDFADEVQRKGTHLEQREKLGLTSSSRPKSHSQTPPPEPTDALQKVEVYALFCLLLLSQGCSPVDSL